MLNKIKSLDQRLFFPFLDDVPVTEYYISKKEYQYPYEVYPDNDGFIDPGLKAYFSKCAADWRLLEFYFRYTKGCTIEPKLQWAITNNHQIIKESAWLYYEQKLAKPYYLRYKLLPKQLSAQKSIVSVHTAWGNYWHFYNDIIGQLALADSFEASKELPILIPKGLYEKKYFQDFLSLSPRLQKKKWVVQKANEYITANEAHFFWAPFAHKKNYDAALDYIDFDHTQIENRGNTKLFLTRSSRRGRILQNESEVLELVKRAGFEVVECDYLTLQQQVNLFQNAGVVMGIHGAAFTNIIYRKGLPLHVVELFPADFINPCYYWMCQQYGFRYSALKGSNVKMEKNNTGAFAITREQLENFLKTLIA